MQCPRCNAKTQVRDTQSHATVTERTRQCVQCRHRFSTIESTEERAKLHRLITATERLQQVIMSAHLVISDAEEAIKYLKT